MSEETRLSTARLRFLVARIHALGPRPLAELFTELADGADLVLRLERYARLDPAVVAALGGSAMPSHVRPVIMESDDAA